MLFCTKEFLLFFLVVFPLYWLTPWRQARVWILLAASFYFYCCWNQYLAALILVTSFMDYVFALAMERTDIPWRRRLLLILSLVMNLGLLVYFKYANFFIQSFIDSARAFGYTGSIGLLTVILPVGISFYTFEAINYTVDVYRKKIPAERNLGHFLLFIMFFPHLVAGPIVRAKDFLRQIQRPKRWSWPRLLLGVGLFVLGWLKKEAVAEQMARFADPVFANPDAYGTGATWLAVVAYALQIYGDFSGYSDMALGLAHTLGYKLTPNFNLPYLATNIAEFWRRWHMSLSNWLRDYLFIPLGGSRGSSLQTARNLLITMTLGGLWHGANWTFVLWGIVHGLLLIVQRAFRTASPKGSAVNGLLESAAGTALRVATTLTCVSLCWVLFRAPTLPVAGAVYRNLFTAASGLGAPVPVYVFWWTLGAVAIASAAGESRVWRELGKRLPAPALGALFAAGLVLALVFSTGQSRAFIYFQF
jgi:alginate O-acetyltransferase complex protein AlgI